MNRSSLRSLWSWMVKQFWWLWAANLLIALFVIFGFVLGWMHGTVTAPNIPAWIGILLGVLAFVGGSLYLRAKTFPTAAMLAVSVMPVPLLLWFAASILFGVFYMVVGLIAHLVGHGR